MLGPWAGVGFGCVWDLGILNLHRFLSKESYGGVGALRKPKRGM